MPLSPPSPSGASGEPTWPEGPHDPGHGLSSGLVAAAELRGLSRRRFLLFCSAMVATLALPPFYTPQVVHALESVKKPVLVWLQFQDCTGDSESLLRSSNPSPIEILLDLLSWEYHEVLMAGSGKSAESVLDAIVRNERGQYLAVVEGSIPFGAGGAYCTIGGRPATEIVKTVCQNAAATIAVGACAWDGGLVKNGPTGAVGVSEAVPGLQNLINLGGCPTKPDYIAAVLTHLLTFKELPPRDSYGRPLFAYGSTIHDQCERRAHYDAGRFVQAWGDNAARAGWCLYKMGCKGPATEANCPNVRWNDGTSWPVQAGHGCIGCNAPRFWDQMSPVYSRLPEPGGLTLDSVGLGVAAVALGAGALGVHALGSAARVVLRPEASTTDEPESSTTEEDSS